MTKKKIAEDCLRVFKQVAGDGKKWTQTLQTALWVVLILIQMALVNCLEVRAEQVRREVLYEDIEGDASFPQEIDVAVLAGTEEERVVCSAVEMEEVGRRWSDDFTFPVTVYDYGAEAYQLGDVTVTGDEGLKLLANEYAQELLESMELSPEEYEVTGLVWEGEPYVSEEGIVCRDARGSGRRLLRDYRVTYEGYLAPERIEELKRRGFGEVEQEEELETEEETESIAQTEAVLVEQEPEIPKEPEKPREKSRLQKLLEKITQILLVAVGIGVILFVGGLLVLGLTWIGRKIKEKRAERKKQEDLQKHLDERKSH